MTLEELKALLEKEENKSLLDGIKSTFSLLDATAVDGLEKKKVELLKEKKELQAKLNRFKALEALDDEEIDELLELKEKKSLTTDNNSGNLELEVLKKKYDKQAQAMLEQMKALQSEKEGITKEYHKTLVEKELSEFFDSVHVAAPHRKILQAALRANIETSPSDNGIDINYVTSEGAKPLKSYLESFFNSDEGKIYIEKPVNTGGGARGGNIQTGTASQAENFNAALQNKDFTAALQMAKPVKK